MSLLTILEYPDKRLRTLATPIETVDATLSALIDDMFETMYDAPGIGLAATQVNVHKQLLVLDIPRGMWGTQQLDLASSQSLASRAS